ncbi:MAG: N-glycosylase/DNA lyase [Candidatus Ratteibacteria bacterium]
MKEINISKKLVEILSKIPFNIWNRIVEKEPEWQNMEFFLQNYNFGPFAVLMVVTGLNDYQLKGKADIVYWPNICKILKQSPPPKSPDELYNVLMPFYKEERLYTHKINRLKKFLKSELASKLWNSSSCAIAKDFLNIWNNLAKIMDQEKKNKTIVFAMKCLAISLLIAKEYEFDFSPIPIPIDSRVRKFTNLLGVEIASDEDVRKFWKDILLNLKKENPNITMVHLDSLIWQISPMGKCELQVYFKDLGISEIGEDLLTILKL